MGFKLPQRTAKLVFEGGEFEGAEVKVILDQPIGALIEAQTLRKDNNIGALCKFVANILREWNLEDNDGKVIPATEQGLLQVTPAFVGALISAWVDAQTEPTPKKRRKSKSGRG